MADDDAWFASGIKGFTFGELDDARDQLRTLQLDDVMSVDSVASSGSDRGILTEGDRDDFLYASKTSRKSLPDSKKLPTTASSAGTVELKRSESGSPEVAARKIEKPKFLRRFTIYGVNKRVEFDPRQVASALFNDETVYGLDTFKSVSDKRELLEEALRTRDSSVILRILVHLRKTTRAKVLRNDIFVPILASTSGNLEAQLFTRCATIYFRKLASYFEYAPLAFESLTDLIPVGNQVYIANCENIYLFEKLSETLTSPTTTCASKRTALKNLLLVFPNDAESAWRRLAITAAHRELQLLDLLVSVQQTFFSSRMKSGGVAATQASLDWLTYLAARSFLDPASDGSGSPQRASGATATAKNEPFKKKLPNVTQSQLTSAQTSVTSGGLSIISAIHAVTLMQCTNALQSHYSELIELARLLTESVGMKEQLLVRIESCARTHCYSELDGLIEKATKTSFGGLQKSLLTPTTILSVLASQQVDSQVLAKHFRTIENVAERRALANRLHCERVLIDLLVETRDRRALEQFAVRLNPRSADYAYVLEVLHRDAQKWKA